MRIPYIKMFVEDGCPFCRAVYDNIVIGYLNSILRLDVTKVNITYNRDPDALWWREYSPSLLGRVGTPAIVFFDDTNPSECLLEPVEIFILSRRGGKIKIKSFKDEILAMRYAIEEFIKENYSEYYNYIMYINNTMFYTSRREVETVSIYGI